MEFKPLLMPRAIIVDESTLTGSYGRFYAEPFERGYGVTIGNSLRRILLSSIQGAAVTAFQIEGVQHEFTGIEGVKEDVSDIVLNLKSLRLKCESAEGEGGLFLDVEGPAVVSAADFERDESVTILNPDQHIANALAAYCALTMAPNGDLEQLSQAGQQARKELHGCFDWIVRRHLREVHPLVWSEAAAGRGLVAHLRARETLWLSGASTVRRFISCLFAAALDQGTSVSLPASRVRLGRAY